MTFELSSGGPHRTWYTVLQASVDIILFSQRTRDLRCYEYCLEKDIISQREGVSFVNHFSYANISSFGQLLSELYNCRFCVGVHWPEHNYIGSLIIYFLLYYYYYYNFVPHFQILFFYFSSYFFLFLLSNYR